VAVSGESASPLPLYMYSIGVGPIVWGFSMDGGRRRPFFLRRRTKKNPKRARAITATGMPTPNPIFIPRLLAEGLWVDATGAEEVLV
jgi:hypothetical protein